MVRARSVATSFFNFILTQTLFCAGIDFDELGNQPIVFRKEPVDTWEDLLDEPQKLANMKRGRLMVILHSAKKVKGKDKNLQCYAIVRLAGSKKGKFKIQTKTTPEIKNGNPKFNDHVCLFDIRDMEKLIDQIFKNGDKSLMCTVEIYDDNYLKDVCIGKTVFDLKDVLMRPATPMRTDFPLDGLSEGGSVNLTVNFFACFNGICRISLVEARNLVNPDRVGNPDVYCYLTMKGGKKKQTFRTPTMNDSSLDPSFDHQMFVFWMDEEAYFNGLKVDIYDDDVGRDDLIGSVVIDLFQYAAVATTNVEPPKERIYPLRKGGEVVACVEFFTCVDLQVVLLEGRNLKNPNFLGKTFDPYVLLSGGSVCGKNGGGVKMRGKTHSDGNATPNWKEEELYTLLCDHKELKLEVFDDDVGKDDLIGQTTISLLDIYKDGSVEKWYEIFNKSGKKVHGEVKLRFTVKSARGVSRAVSSKIGYPAFWDKRGRYLTDKDDKKKYDPTDADEWAEKVVQPYTIQGYGVRGKQYDRAVPARGAGAVPLGGGGISAMFSSM